MPCRNVLLAIAVACLTGGCIIPFPHIKQTCGSIDGIVIDQLTELPIKKADVKVCYPDGGSKDTTTDNNGRFRFSSKYRFHWGIVISPALGYSLPYDMGWRDFLCITIKTEGYAPACIYVRDSLGASPMFSKGDKYAGYELEEYLRAKYEVDLDEYEPVKVKCDKCGESQPMESKAKWICPEIPLNRIESQH